MNKSKRNRKYLLCFFNQPKIAYGFKLKTAKQFFLLISRNPAMVIEKQKFININSTPLS